MKDMKKTSLIKWIVLAVALLALPWILRFGFDWNYGVQLVCFFMLYVVAVSGLDVLFGYSGQISMGHAAFFCIGAYVSVLVNKHFGVPIVLTMVIGASVAAAIGAALAYPASKLVFHFLSLATIAFGEVVFQLVAQSPGNITGNFTGIYTDYINLFGYRLKGFTNNYYFFLVVTVAFLIFKKNMINSRVGRALAAIRENSHAANGMGVNVRKYKVLAFAVSAFYTAYAGAMYAHLTRFICPDNFAYKQSVMFMTMLLFGGTASIAGPMVGVFSVQFLNEILRSAQKYQLLIYGVLMLLVIVAMPGGVYGVYKDIVANIKYKRAQKNAKKEEVKK